MSNKGEPMFTATKLKNAIMREGLARLEKLFSPGVPVAAQNADKHPSKHAKLQPPQAG